MKEIFIRSFNSNQIINNKRACQVKASSASFNAKNCCFLSTKSINISKMSMMVYIMLLLTIIIIFFFQNIPKNHQCHF